MKILFSLLDSSVGGGQRVAIEIARRLTDEGDTVGLLVPEEGPASEEFRGCGASVYQADLQTLRRRAGVAPAADLARSYDVLYSHTSVPGEILGSRVAGRAGIAHVVHRHTDPHFSPQPATRLIQRLLYRRELRTTLFIAVAGHVAGTLQRLGVEDERISLIPNGVSVENIRERSSRTPVSGTELSVGTMGRFDPSRGLDIFVEAIRRVSQPGVKFAIGAVPGPFRDHESAVRRLATEVGVSIEKPGSRGVEFLSSLDIVVIPSRYEGSPLTLFEAMALGKPIIASRIPGIAEVLEPHGAGVLVPPDDPAPLADAIASLVADPSRRRTLGGTALRVVRREHDLDGVLDRVVEVLRRAADAG